MLRAKNAQQRIADPLPECPAKQSDEASLAVLRAGLACRAGIHCSSSPEPLLIKDIKVQVNKQKLSNVCPAQMKHNSDKMTIAPMSSQPCSKPNVGCSCLFTKDIVNYCFVISFLLVIDNSHIGCKWWMNDICVPKI